MHHRAAHSDHCFDQVIKRLGKEAFLREHTEEEFMAIFGRSYET
jgi:hypothetical protein